MSVLWFPPPDRGNGLVKTAPWLSERVINLLLISAATAIIFVSTPALAAPRPITIVGHLENAMIPLRGIPDMAINSKMDTGADMTSIHAINITHYTKNGEEWVRFTVRAGGRGVIFRRRLVRTARIRRTGTAVVERPVVEIGICIAGYYRLAQVNLTDRSKMSTPLLVGRRFMAPGRLVVDSSEAYLGSPVCPGAP